MSFFYYILFTTEIELLFRISEEMFRNTENRNKTKTIILFMSLTACLLYFFSYNNFSLIVFDRTFFVCYLFTLWLPQIIKNFIDNSSTSLPHFIVLSLSINRIFLPVSLIMLIT